MPLPSPLLVTLLVSADPLAQQSQNGQQKMQDVLMRQFLPDDDDFLVSIAHNDPVSPVCGDAEGKQPWRGIICESKRVTHVLYSFRKRPDLRVEFLPQTVRHIKIGGNGVQGTLALRRLPSRLIHLDITKNLYCGTIDMRDVPRTLETFLARYNRFTHAVRFSELPPKIKQVDLEDNRIATGKVYVGELPETLERLVFWGNVDVRLRSLPGTKIDTQRFGKHEMAIWSKT